MPDILYQLLQCLIRHLVIWVKQAYSIEGIDARCQKLPCNSHVCHFFKGISPLSRITGKEHNNIVHILFGLIIDMHLPDGQSAARLLRATRALLDFLFLAQYPVHSDESLKCLQDALRWFHNNKEIFVDLGIRKDFNLLKLHFLMHYLPLIKYKGTADNFDTVYAERLHINLAKDVYGATNHKDELPQMTRWIECKEKIRHFDNYIMWCLKGSPSITIDLSYSYPACRIKMIKHPLRRKVSFHDLQTQYGARFLVDVLTRYIA